ncbi:hypothetical protein [Streptomyces sp. Da 82-17]|uniref:hypothetical protein n=1 Tax=Streptomyces sp. Da 82-17 TaxID=3377116 RepID=UPI0038D435D8
MTTQPRPHLKSLPVVPEQPSLADNALPAAGEGDDKKVARQGVLSALPTQQPRSGPAPRGGRFPVAWLQVAAPRGARPTGTSICLCGRDRSAIGQTDVLALIADHQAHKTLCPLRTNTEGRNAA